MRHLHTAEPANIDSAAIYVSEKDCSVLLCESFNSKNKENLLKRKRVRKFLKEKKKGFSVEKWMKSILTLNYCCNEGCGQCWR